MVQCNWLSEGTVKGSNDPSVLKGAVANRVPILSILITFNHIIPDQFGKGSSCPEVAWQSQLYCVHKD